MRKVVISVFLVLILFFVSTKPVKAETITVTDTGNLGAGTLRQAVKDAADGDIINFDPSLNGQIITLSTSEINIDKSISIEGPGADLLAISGNDQRRIFNVNDASSELRSVNISGLTIINGAQFKGGAILNSENLVIDSCYIIFNSSTKFGGGVANEAILTIRNSDINNNSVYSDGPGVGFDVFGGGIFNDFNSVLKIDKTTVSKNSAVTEGDNAFAHGGGIYNAEDSSAEITNSTISKNSARTQGIESNAVGGGIKNFSSSLIMINSTVADNEISSVSGIPQGGGLNITTSSTDIIFSTIAFNSSLNGNFPTTGSGLFSFDSANFIKNTIVASNPDSFQPKNCDGPSNDNTFSGNISDDASCGFTSVINPQLLPLNDYGGKTKTVALYETSPAIDVIASGQCNDEVFITRTNLRIIDTDQRGIQRPQGPLCDTGSYEFSTTANEPPADGGNEGDSGNGDGTGEDNSGAIDLGNAGCSVSGPAYSTGVPISLLFIPAFIFLRRKEFKRKM